MTFSDDLFRFVVGTVANVDDVVVLVLLSFLRRLCCIRIVGCVVGVLVRALVGSLWYRFYENDFQR